MKVFKIELMIWEDEIEGNYYQRKMFQEPVEFNCGAFYPISEQPPENFTVIGNIYENPELLS